MLRAARACIRLGWPLFVQSYTEGGLQEATTFIGQIETSLGEVTRGLLCLRTGAPSGTVVIEISGPAGLRTAEILARAGLLPDTVTILTGGGGGYLLYAHPGVFVPSGANLLGPGVHVQADGGHIQLPPSRNRNNGFQLKWTSGKPQRPSTPLHPRILSALRDQALAA
ncbi:bifunctional DNA primase/polymerase [Sphaerisporangium rhizosphaerae]|uniref:Bifunctional DNA primase/polymerase n=1 Tax=Sphaerisporangium rhizosphaerae TaxID=2269375 RepID=A0ABW2NTZ6_9ACTN